jgi:YHS domain-containing protein
MGMAERSAGRGHVGVRGMFSVEPWTIRGCGYPDLLASGERCAGERLHDRQHPHDLAMEIAAEYDAPIGGGARWQVFGGPAAEPALGPVAYPHRVSAMPNPLAPITHHWLDSTHISFGVVTAGVYGQRWKVESSAFNGREPDENRTNFDFGALDSLSGRVWFLPTATVALQVSGGHLRAAEAGDPGEAPRDVDRVTASATFHRISATRVSASTFAWGRNSESGRATNALLLETVVTFSDRDTWFGRLEVVAKTPHDLDVPPIRDTFTVSKIQGGYTRYVAGRAGFKAGFGATGSMGILPPALRSFYGSRVNPGVGVFLTLRPAMMSVDVHAPNASSAGARSGTMVMVQTAFDPAKLTCQAGFDPGAAASTTYEGTTYYFCSAEDRDRFLTDPNMSLSMMPPKQ